ncbi:MAG: fumarylacetoacetate hydrolase family protein [Candidatus Bathyarchaeia archaeon]
MKIATFEANKRERLGAVIGDKIIDLSMAYAEYLLAVKKIGNRRAKNIATRRVPSEILSFLRGSQEALDASDKGLDYIKRRHFESPSVFYLDSVTLRPPVPRPSKLVCFGLNFEDYRKILGIEPSSVPLFFLKPPSTLIGPGETIVLPKGYGEIYHEFELAAVIWRRARKLSRREAYDAIFGFTIFNDITAHDLELLSREYQPWAKAFDTFSPMGPWIVTKDQMPEDLYDLKMTRRRNGQTECESSTKQMRWKIHEMIPFISTFTTLEPGDVVTFASPPAGPIYPGDVIEAEVEGIGVLRNPVAGEEIGYEYARAAGL